MALQQNGEISQSLCRPQYSAQSICSLSNRCPSVGGTAEWCVFGCNLHRACVVPAANLTALVSLQQSRPRCTMPLIQTVYTAALLQFVVVQLPAADLPAIVKLPVTLLPQNS